MGSDMSSSIREIFLPPSAAEWDETGRFRKLNTVPLSCATATSERKRLANKKVKRCILIITYVYRLQRYNVSTKNQNSKIQKIFFLLTFAQMIETLK
jgi:hypothetical protein